jgi:hypothetical protein
MAKTVTSFLLALSDSRKMRDKYRNPDKRRSLLEEWDLEDSPLFQSGATADDFRQAVVAESGLKQVEYWISVDGVPIANPDYDENA